MKNQKIRLNDVFEYIEMSGEDAEQIFKQEGCL